MEAICGVREGGVRRSSTERQQVAPGEAGLSTNGQRIDLAYADGKVGMELGHEGFLEMGFPRKWHWTYGYTRARHNPNLQSEGWHPAGYMRA